MFSTLDYTVVSLLALFLTPVFKVVDGWKKQKTKNKKQKTKQRQHYSSLKVFLKGSFFPPLTRLCFEYKVSVKQ